MNSAFFIKTMKNFVDSLSEQGKANWLRLYKKFKRREWKPAEKDKRGITCETKIEDAEEIGRMMRRPSRGAWHE